MLGLKKRQKERDPEALSLEELLTGVYLGDYGSWYEHEISRKVERRYTQAPDKERFIKEEVPALPGYDAEATEAIYRSRGIEAAFVVNLPDVEQFDPPACALYLVPGLPEGVSGRWSSVRFYGYKVLPRFYEPVGIHELIGWRLIERFPTAEEVHPDTPSLGQCSPDFFWKRPHLDETTGVMSFGARPDGLRRARRFGVELKEAMEEVGVLCDPVVSLANARDYDPLAPKDTHRPQLDDTHPYHSAQFGSPWDAAPAGANGEEYVKPDGHQVIPSAGPGVPDQKKADELLDRLERYKYWESLKLDLDRRMEDPKIPQIRLASLLEQRAGAAEESEKVEGLLLQDSKSLLGLMLSMEDALARLSRVSTR